MKQRQQLPRTIHNPNIGDSVTFLKTNEDTGGAYTLVEVTLAEGGGNGLHYHTDYIEEFVAIEGVLGVQIEKKIIELQPGETAKVPLNVAHRFYNPGKGEIKFEVKIIPSRSFEPMLRIAYGLANDGLCNKKGIPRSIWHLALLFEIGESYLPGLPLRLQKGLFGLLARIARWKGKDKELERYYVASEAEVNERNAALEYAPA